MALAKRAANATAYVELGGTRAAWLARTFPELAGDVWWGTGEDWDEAWAAAQTGAAKAALVRRIRQLDPPRAREALADWWASILRTIGRARSKLSKYRSNRRTNPSSPRHSPIEGPTCAGPHWGLLVLLPDSALTRRIEAEAMPLLATGGLVRKSLKVTLPS